MTMLIIVAAIDKIPSKNDRVYAIMPLIANKFNDYYLIDLLSQYVKREKDQWLLYECLNPENE